MDELVLIELEIAAGIQVHTTDEFSPVFVAIAYTYVSTIYGTDP